MSGQKSNYPERPLLGKRPPNPGTENARKKPSRTHGGGKRKGWVSLREKVEGGRDVGAKSQMPWYKCPLMKEARIKKWAKN
jgi:hypothetical protein